jgi:ubiquinone biosynthesis protein COQ4
MSLLSPLSQHAASALVSALACAAVRQYAGAACLRRFSSQDAHFAPFRSVAGAPSSPAVHPALAFFSSSSSSGASSVAISAASGAPSSGASAWVDSHAAHYQPLSACSRLLLPLFSSILASLDTHRADMVHALSETSTPSLVLDELQKRMNSTEEGRWILEHKPRVDDSLLVKLRDYPSSSFGFAYSSFLHSHSYRPSHRPHVRFIAAAPLAYVLQRYREVHDFWHVLLGLDVSVEGEIAQKFFEFLHTKLPFALTATLYAPLRLSPSALFKLSTTYLPWAVQCNRQCSDLMSIHFERYFAENLDELRVRWNLLPAPTG